MKTSAGNRTFDKLILAIGIVVAIMAGIQNTSNKNMIKQTSDTLTIVKNSFSDGDTANNASTRVHLDNRLKIN